MTLAKRIFDVFSTMLGLLVLAPVLGVISLLVLLDDGRPVLYRQLRVGQGGRPFRILKFRTMVLGAEEIGGQLTVGSDPRITRTGRWLRRTKLDELPQLFNVLVGQMSLVGPRPEVPRYVERYTGGQRRVLELRPGISDPASIRFRNEASLLAAAADAEAFYVSTLMPAKIELNLQYAARATLWSDMGIVLRTLAVLTLPERDASLTEQPS